MLATVGPSLAAFFEGSNPAAPAHLGTRYDTSGNFLLEPGNTVVSHLVQDSPSEAAIIEVRERMRAMPDADRLAFTPVSSLHMTLFQGIIEYRRRLPYWPADIPLDTSIDDMTRLYLERLQGFQPCPPFRVKTIGVTPNGLTVAGASDEDERTLRLWRDALTVPFGYRHPDHDTYVFHITFAYQIRRLADERASAWQDLFDDCLSFLEREAPVIEFRPPAFCSFKDMKHFEELLVLG
ncbi:MULTISPECIES: DUF1868 domain-containing protein [unclassified Mesorhizobium]|uniref:DUF1868 domain-containing protein n=1 Tax=unclassified Mesorhizobium TaxID=325217 RepID=UPI000FCA2B5B|nr:MULTISPECIES: DUF1868 domain-containing protein [unclassified Mesorhizobium]TGP23508.1 DUF1868 domain-containing protein [Mesorhizobium sp. M1D.F.Ca.ET.231.01.1.1]TGP33651.1 DUF1868 domain-containing protein [Mesorhizobium sp. M1D.F.Ca.ET.234.01.1.1]TGS47017.1 DUF1868 domain-containing protein [Mesorhizobium sp. M1D.F.Ca.ET.184.01.1.1]TGS62276.1 DUF1868 domain-containing protein [Mesorhizobium sp. M1D.F.Ca.ET.183.01.1.1]